ncbi:trehalase-like isoform X2 [Leptopilina heterotoma]|nr:trehalase-like isoform X2 [Leptopilina heterotoma]XP_043471923.1 trehalase-like isoform X2 [Leptopilina heterotoma]
MTRTNRKPTKSELEVFISDAFTNQTELEEWIPPDWNKYPPILSHIQDPKFKIFAKNLNDLWKILARKIKPEVALHPNRHSLIPVENGFIIPGGRFKEFYYWDSYWIIKGLLLSNMYSTAKGMIKNFVSFVDNYGFIPNGGRVYYLMRSQPPLLTYMVQTYVDVTQDYKFVEEILPSLDREFEYWEKKKTVNVPFKGKNYVMARYYVEDEGPRPESYREDYKLARNLTRKEDKKELYENLKAGAESGWDFSARWFVSSSNLGQSARRNISNIATKYIIPVDLNAYLQRNAKRLSKFHAKFGNFVKSRYYQQIAMRYQVGIQTLLWNEKDGIWYDYDMLHKRQRNIFYPSNFAPLYTRSYNIENRVMYAKRTLNYIKTKNITSFLGGIPTSLDDTGEQWDFPNAWAPLQSMVIVGLYLTNYEPAVTLSKELATRWLRSNHIGFNEFNEMFEKYDAVKPGFYGGGGEYVVQSGFGWTNGVIFELLDIYCTATSDDNVKVPNVKCRPIPA